MLRPRAEANSGSATLRPATLMQLRVGGCWEDGEGHETRNYLGSLGGNATDIQHAIAPSRPPPRKDTGL